MMNTTAKNLAIVLGIFAIAIDSTITENTSAQVRSLAQAEGDNAGKAATQTIKIDGSSTVYPITQAIAKQFQAEPTNQAQVEVKISGTTGGFEKKIVNKFVQLYIDRAAAIATSVGYVPLPEAVRNINYIHFNKGKTGTAFSGKARLNAKISDLLPKKAEY